MIDLPEPIFRQYDIRGTYSDEINEQNSIIIGKSIGTYYKKLGLTDLVVGHDNRPSSVSISKPFVEGILSTGCNVTFIQHTITPVIHYLTSAHDFEGGIMITASHNPKEYTGFRLDLNKALSVYGNELRKIYKIAETQSFETGKGLLHTRDLNYLYINNLFEQFKGLKKFNVVIDTGNGSAANLAPLLFKKLGCNVFGFNNDLNGGFDLGVPDPENTDMLARISSEVLATNADVGFAFDLDADRFGLVDNKGAFYSSDKLLMLFLEHQLKTKKGKVLFDVKSTQNLFDIVTKNGGTPSMLKTGHSYFLEQMDENAVIGAEYSGHFYFWQNFGYDDGLFVACKVLEILSSTEKTLNDLIKVYPKMYHTKELKLGCPEEHKFKLIDALTKTMQEMPQTYKKILTIDGIRVSFFDDSWFLVRASNTTPVLSVRFEAKTQEQISKMLSMVKNMLSPFEVVNLEPMNDPKIYYS